LRIVNDILDLAKVEAGKFSLSVGPFSLRNAINEVVRLMEFAIDAKELGIIVTIAEQIPEHLIGDQVRIRQIILNLLGNAIKFTEQGTIVVTAAIDRQEGETITLCLSVRDTGIGMSQEIVRTIFEPFTQADSSNTRRFGGTGLGLTICNRLIELMGGQIMVKSAAGEGSTFTVILPLRLVEQLSLAPESGLWPRATVNEQIVPSLGILLAEDKANIRLFAVRALKSLGHCVTEARDGTVALEHWRNREFDLILMDIQMPNMDGIQVTEAIRAHEQGTGEHIPIIAMTAHALQGEDEEFLKHGFDDYVSKPFELHDLSDAINRTISSKHHNQR
jgi:CheY-like chemotaxis protein